MLKHALCFFLLKSCGPPNDIISFFGPRLKKFAVPWLSITDLFCPSVRIVCMFTVSLTEIS